MLIRALLIWFAMAICAVLNGALRETVLKAYFSELTRHVISTLILGAAIIGTSFVAIGWIAPVDGNQALMVGALWVILTLAFEFLAGHYVFGNSWEAIWLNYHVTKGYIWVLVPAVTLLAPSFAYYGVSGAYAIPHAISLLVALAILVAAYLEPNGARWGLILLFGYAAIYNGWVGATHPQEYQEFAKLAIIPFYRDFVGGSFGAYAGPMIMTIACGQAVIALRVPFGGRWLRLGAVGACVFLTAILPLGVGSAFPFGIIVSLAVFVMCGRLWTCTA